MEQVFCPKCVTWEVPVTALRGGWRSTSVMSVFHVCVMTLSYVSHDSFKCATWFIHVLKTALRVQQCVMGATVCDLLPYA